MQRQLDTANSIISHQQREIEELKARQVAPQSPRSILKQMTDKEEAEALSLKCTRLETKYQKLKKMTKSLYPILKQHEQSIRCFAKELEITEERELRLQKEVRKASRTLIECQRQNSLYKRILENVLENEKHGYPLKVCNIIQFLPELKTSTTKSDKNTAKKQAAA